MSSLHVVDDAPGVVALKINPDGAEKFRLIGGPMDRKEARVYGRPQKIQFGEASYVLAPPAGRQKKWFYQYEGASK